MATKTTDVSRIKMQIMSRIHLGNIMPERGGLSTMLTRKSVVDKVTVTPKDMETVAWQDLDNGQVAWDAEKDKGVIFSFTGLETELIVRQLRKLAEDEQLLPAHIELWSLFIEKQES